MLFTIVEQTVCVFISPFSGLIRNCKTVLKMFLLRNQLGSFRAINTASTKLLKSNNFRSPAAINAGNNGIGKFAVFGQRYV